jgi:hypothetical protein
MIMKDSPSSASAAVETHELLPWTNSRTELALAPLVCAWNLHVFTILCNRTPGDLDTLTLEFCRKILVSPRFARILLLYKLLNPALQKKQG